MCDLPRRSMEGEVECAFNNVIGLCKLSVVWFSAIVTPVRVSFLEIHNPLWISIEVFTDLVFTLDIIFSFFTAYYNRVEVLISSKRTISLSYLKSWFILDIIAILPLDYITNTGFNHFGQMLRIPRVFKLIKASK